MWHICTGVIYKVCYTLTIFHMQIQLIKALPSGKRACVGMTVVIVKEIGRCSERSDNSFYGLLDVNRFLNFYLSPESCSILKDMLKSMAQGYSITKLFRCKRTSLKPWVSFFEA